jgi:hypothetical protein
MSAVNTSRINVGLLRKFVQAMKTVKEMLDLRGTIDQINMAQLEKKLAALVDHNNSSLDDRPETDLNDMVQNVLLFVENSLGIVPQEGGFFKRADAGTPNLTEKEVENFMVFLMRFLEVLMSAKGATCGSVEQKKAERQQFLQSIHGTSLEAYLLDVHKTLKVNCYLTAEEFASVAKEDNAFYALALICKRKFDDLNGSDVYLKTVDRLKKLGQALSDKPFMTNAARRALQPIAFDHTKISRNRDYIPFALFRDTDGFLSTPSTSLLDQMMSANADRFNCTGTRVGNRFLRGRGDDDDDDDGDDDDEAEEETTDDDDADAFSNDEPPKKKLALRPFSSPATTVTTISPESERSSHTAIAELNENFKRTMTEFNMSLAKLISDSRADRLDDDDSDDADDFSTTPHKRLERAHKTREKVVALINRNLEQLFSFLDAFTRALVKVDRSSNPQTLETISRIAELDDYWKQRDAGGRKMLNNIHFFLRVISRIRELLGIISVVGETFDEMESNVDVFTDVALSVANVSFSGLKYGKTLALNFLPLSFLTPFEKLARSHRSNLKSLATKCVEERVFLNINTFNVVPLEYIVLYGEDSVGAAGGFFSNKSLLDNISRNRDKYMTVFLDYIVFPLLYNLREADRTQTADKRVCLKRQTTTAAALSTTMGPAKAATRLVSSMSSTLTDEEKLQYIRGVCLVSNAKYSRGATHIYMTALMSFFESTLVVNLVESTRADTEEMVVNMLRELMMQHDNCNLVNMLTAKLLTMLVLLTPKLKRVEFDTKLTYGLDSRLTYELLVEVLANKPDLVRNLATTYGITLTKSPAGELRAEFATVFANDTARQLSSMIQVSPEFFAAQNESPVLLNIFNYIRSVDRSETARTAPPPLSNAAEIGAALNAPSVNNFGSVGDPFKDLPGGTDYLTANDPEIGLFGTPLDGATKEVQVTAQKLSSASSASAPATTSLERLALFNRIAQNVCSTLEMKKLVRDSLADAADVCLAEPRVEGMSPTPSAQSVLVQIVGSGTI